VQPSQDVVDARTFPGSSGGFRIEFNPNRARPRVNYSIAHEIAHTLFPDCARAIRNRYTHADTKPEDWQLEMLCNVAASEFLMPIGSFSIDERRSASIDKILEWRNKYSVSTEAILLRYAKLALQPSLVFTAHRDESRTPGRYCIDYAIPSRTWTTGIRTGFLLPAGSAVEECTGIGFTAKSEEVWVASDGPRWVECVGVPSYPGSTYPRVMGLLAPKSKRVAAATAVSYLTGDAASPRGPGKKVIVQLVNDKALTWGRGFAVAVRKKWPEAQRAFSDWALTHKGEFRLGGVHFTKLDSNVELASLVAQHGYGPSPHTDFATPLSIGAARYSGITRASLT